MITNLFPWLTKRIDQQTLDIFRSNDVILLSVSTQSAIHERLILEDSCLHLFLKGHWNCDRLKVDTSQWRQAFESVKPGDLVGILYSRDYNAIKISIGSENQEYKSFLVHANYHSNRIDDKKLQILRSIDTIFLTVSQQLIGDKLSFNEDPAYIDIQIKGNRSIPIHDGSSQPVRIDPMKWRKALENVKPWDLIYISYDPKCDSLKVERKDEDGQTLGSYTFWVTEF